MSFVNAIIVSKAITKQREKAQADHKNAMKVWWDLAKKREREE